MTQSDIKTWVNAGSGNVTVTLSIKNPTTMVSAPEAADSETKVYTLKGTVAQAGHQGLVIENGKKLIR